MFPFFFFEKKCTRSEFIRENVQGHAENLKGDLSLFIEQKMLGAAVKFDKSESFQDRIDSLEKLVESMVGEVEKEREARLQAVAEAQMLREQNAEFGLKIDTLIRDVARLNAAAPRAQVPMQTHTPIQVAGTPQYPNSTPDMFNRSVKLPSFTELTSTTLSAPRTPAEYVHTKLQPRQPTIDFQSAKWQTIKTYVNAGDFSRAFASASREGETWVLMLLKENEELLHDLSPLAVDCSNTIMRNITSALQRSSEG